MSCSSVDLKAYFWGEADAKEKRLAEDHLRACAHCQEELDRLKSLGVNFFSSFITPLETQASGLGRYDQNICGRLDQLLELCEQRGMQLSLNLWFHAFLSETVWGGGNERWETNPYSQVTKPKDFYRSDAAWAFQEKLYRYMIARWGYSRSLGIWFIVDEINGEKVKTLRGEHIAERIQLLRRWDRTGRRVLPFVLKMLGGE